MSDRASGRRKLLATLIVLLPILAGLTIAALAHFLGGEQGGIQTPAPAPPPPPASRPHLLEAATPAASGSPAPRVRLAEPATGRRFDSAALGKAPYAVVFTSTRCEAIGDFLARAARRLSGDGAILVISADPRLDSPRAVRGWLAKHHVKERGPLHFLTGGVPELSDYWGAWGFRGPTRACPASVPAHLVGSSKGSYVNTGTLDLDPGGPAAILTVPLRALDR